MILFPILMFVFIFLVFLAFGAMKTPELGLSILMIAIILGLWLLCATQLPKPVILCEYHPILEMTHPDGTKEQVFYSSDHIMMRVPCQYWLSADKYQMKETVWAGRRAFIYYRTQPTYEIVQK